MSDLFTYLLTYLLTCLPLICNINRWAEELKNKLKFCLLKLSAVLWRSAKWCRRTWLNSVCCYGRTGCCRSNALSWQRSRSSSLFSLQPFFSSYACWSSPSSNLCRRSTTVLRPPLLFLPTWPCQYPRTSVLMQQVSRGWSFIRRVHRRWWTGSVEISLECSKLSREVWRYSLVFRMSIRPVNLLY